MKKGILLAIFVFFLISITLFFIFTPWRMTLKTFSFLFSILPIEEIELSENIIREIYQKDEETSFYIFRPKDEKKYPGLVLSLGIHPEGAEDKRLQKIFQGLVENGVVVITVHSVALKESLIEPKEIKNLVKAFQFLETQPFIDSNKIRFFGLSVGSSLAFLAAGDPEIKGRVKYILWSGGYFDAKELIKEVLSKSFLYQGKINSWEPSPRIQEVVQKNLERFLEEEKTKEGRAIIEKIIESKNRNELEKLFENLPFNMNETLESLSPKNSVSQMKAPLFILHGEGDKIIPFSHSVLLAEKYPGEKTVIISEKYGHISPEFSFKDLFSKEFWQAINLGNKLLLEIY